MKNKVAIIVPTKNEQQYLPRLIQSLENQTFQGFIKILADANSSDQTRQIAQRHGFIITEGGHPYLGRNNGAKKAIDLGAELLIFIDADVILPNPIFLEQALNEFHQRNLDVAGPLITPYEIKNNQVVISSNPRFQLIYQLTNIGMLMLEKTHRPAFQVFMMARTSVHQTIGGFPAMEFAEDSQYATNAVAHGFRFGILRQCGKVLVSPRRFQKKGIFGSRTPYFLANYFFGGNLSYGKTRLKYFDE